MQCSQHFRPPPAVNLRQEKFCPGSFSLPLQDSRVLLEEITDSYGCLTNGVCDLLRIHPVLTVSREYLQDLAFQVFIGDRLTTDTDGAGGCSVAGEFFNLLFQICHGSTGCDQFLFQFENSVFLELPDLKFKFLDLVKCRCGHGVSSDLRALGWGFESSVAHRMFFIWNWSPASARLTKTPQNGVGS